MNNQKWNGKIKEYNEYGIPTFEGELVNGKRHGYGEEYHENGQIFEGEYFNGKRHGKGKEYNVIGELIFEGEYANGEKKENN